MAENTPATDAGTPTPQRAARKPVHRKETTPTPSGCPTTKKKSKTDIAIEQAAARLAAQAPPLSEGQKRRIAELFAPAVAAVKRLPAALVNVGHSQDGPVNGSRPLRYNDGQ